MTNEERRQAQRAPAKLAMEIRLSGEGQARVESINVSANGVYFSSSQYIAPLTKLGITLLLPGDTDVREVSCDGVVVRIDPDVPETTQEYEVACYFTGISEKDRKDLESYILNQLAF